MASDLRGGEPLGLDRVLDLLRCPHCADALDRADRSVRCRSGHSFDLAKQGYVNFLTRPVKGSNADTAEMIAARDRFLSAGHYLPLATKIAELAERPQPVEGPAIAEFGAGTGYYLKTVLDRIPTARGIAADLSSYACRRAARAHPRLGAIVADTWQPLPITDQALDLIMVVFAPRNAAEFARVLRPGGRLLVASAGQDHLAEIRDTLQLLDIEPGKQDRLIDQLSDHFEPIRQETFADTLQLDRDDLYDLVAMGPNAHHQGDRLRDRIAALEPPVTVGCQVELTLFGTSS